jgi:biopolymer transport protein ExbD
MRNARDEKLETPITSMIDIVFLLIIFFVITSTIQQEAVDHALVLAKSKWTEPASLEGVNKVIINVGSTSGSETIVNIGGIHVGLVKLTQLLTVQRQRHGENVQIVIRAAGDLEFRHVDAVMSAVGDANLSRVRLAASAEE